MGKEGEGKLFLTCLRGRGKKNVCTGEKKEKGGKKEKGLSFPDYRRLARRGEEKGKLNVRE